MATNNNSNFANLTVKSTPTTSDLLILSDQAANGVEKQSAISNFPAINAQQITQFNTAVGATFPATLPGLLGSLQSSSLTQTMGVLLNSNVVFIPFYVSIPWSLSSMTAIVSVGLAASTITMGVYASTPASGGTFANLPVGSPLAAGSAASATSNALCTPTVSTSLSANTLYYAAIQISSAVTISIQVSKMCFGCNTINSASSGATMATSLYSIGHVYSAGTLPAITQASISSSVVSYCPTINCQ